MDCPAESVRWGSFVKKVPPGRHVRTGGTHTGKFCSGSVRAQRVRGSGQNFVPRRIPGGRNFCRAYARRNGFPLERFLQVKHPVPDLLGTALVPELCPDITAGAAGHVQLALVTVAALGALPDQLAVVLHDLDLAVVAAALAVVRLGVQLG